MCRAFQYLPIARRHSQSGRVRWAFRDGARQSTEEREDLSVIGVGSQCLFVISRSVTQCPVRQFLSTADHATKSALALQADVLRCLGSPLKKVTKRS